MARLPKVPKIEKFDDECAKISCYDEGKFMEDRRSKEIQLGCEPLPKGWEQCLDLKTGELYYIDRSCSKRTKRDPRPIVKKVEKEIDARMSCIWGNAEEAKDSDSGLSTNSSNTSSGTPISIFRNSFGFKKPVVGNDKLVILKGCSKCMSYILIPRGIKNCPSCNAHLFMV